MRRLILVIGLTTLLAPRPAEALFGEEDWLSGQNQLLFSLLAENIQHTTQLASAVMQLRGLLTTANETAALTRTAWRQVQILRRYDVDDLRRDALAGLYDAWPELRDVARETEALVANGRAVHRGRFWTHLDHHDPAVSRRARAAFEYGYQSTIWPIAFPRAVDHTPTPSPVDEKVAELYARTGHAHRVAMQQMAWSVFAQEVESYVDDAQATDRLDTRIEAMGALMQYQTMRNTTEAVNLEKTQAADAEARRTRDAEDRKAFSEGGRAQAPSLWSPARVWRSTAGEGER